MPLSVYFDLYGWHLGDDLCRAWIVMDVLLPFIAILILLVMNIDHLLLVSNLNMYSRFLKREILVCSLTFPWIMGILVVVPLWTQGAAPVSVAPGDCMIALNLKAAIVSPVLTFFLPTLIILLLVLPTLVKIIRHRQTSVSNSEYSMVSISTTGNNTANANANQTHSGNTVRRRSNPVNTPTTPAAVGALLVVDLLFISMWFPYKCVGVFLMFCETPDCVPSFNVLLAFTWLGLACSGLTPLAWFVDSVVRRNCLRYIYRCFRKQAVAPSNTLTTSL
jgi:hypothetical protein